jgi:predicted N-formylglutamate amidohydrolase
MHRNDVTTEASESSRPELRKRKYVGQLNTGVDNVFLVTCEHGGNRIPSVYRYLFNDAHALLRTHRGYDAGALVFARELAKMLDVPFYISTISRLLIDLNRSIGHPRLYSEFTRGAPISVRREIMEQYYRPYRNEVESTIAQTIAQGHRVIHFSSHSFTPELDGKVRNTDVGFLYDPARPAEAELCRQWQATLRSQTSTIRTRLNYPYSGTADGFTVYLRRKFPADLYVGLELEINQKHVRQGGQQWIDLRAALIRALRTTLVSQTTSHSTLVPNI